MFLFPVLLTITDEQSKLRAEFESLALPALDILYNFALRMTGSKKKASGLIEETYRKAFGFFPYFERNSDCKEWLFRIMRNTYQDKFGKADKKKIEFNSGEINGDPEKIRSLAGSLSYDAGRVFEISDDELSGLIGSLPDDFRIVLILNDIMKFTHEEIADFVDVPTGVVRSRLYRARKMLFSGLYKYASAKGLTNRPDNVNA
jgi:RNA polymerase sigma-70 factor (ECF subfamily)